LWRIDSTIKRRMMRSRRTERGASSSRDVAMAAAYARGHTLRAIARHRDVAEITGSRTVRRSQLGAVRRQEKYRMLDCKT
jgi:hypothetical protein